MALKSRNKVSASFNMSSMTDIVFLLLIFFMLTFGIPRHEELDLQLPKGSGKTIEPSGTIAVHIKDVEGDTIKIPNLYIDIGSGPVTVEFENIAEKLKIAKEDIEEFKGISLYADKTVDVQYVSKIMSIASINDYKIGLVVTDMK
jgi:biopolymer transport protein ExbD